MAVRHIYLKIESIPDYSPVCPDPTAAPPIRYGRACMRNMGHEDGTIPTSEINGRTVSNVHTVTEDAAGMPSFCLNGRSFIGNTPTILTEVGQKIRWYVFNLDLGMMWHNFHPHGQRWHFAGEAYDGRGLGPAESFVVETTAPPVLLLPADIAKGQDPEHRPKHAKKMTWWLNSKNPVSPKEIDVAYRFSSCLASPLLASS